MKRFPHAIKPNHRSELPNRIVYFDIESHVEDIDKDEFIEKAIKSPFRIEHDPYLCCSCFTDRDHDTWLDFHGENWQQKFWTRVANFCKTNSKVWVFAHNAKYDVLASGGIKYLVELGWTVTAFSDGNPFFIRLTKRVPKEEYIEKLKFKIANLTDPDKKNKQIIELDKIKKGEKMPPSVGTILLISSTNYYNTSLKNLGETFNLPKLDAAYNAPLNEAIPYCQRDVKILKIAMESFFNFVETEELGTMGMTIASQAMNAYRHRFMPHEIFIHDNKAAIILEREAYSGGRTEAWYIGQAPETLYCFDVNSMYPHVMLENDYPINLVTYRNHVSLSDLHRFISLGYLLVAKVKIVTDTPVFMLKDEKLIFPTGTFWTSLCTPELIYGLENDLIQDVSEVAIYKKANIFTDYVTYFYNQRLKAKAAKNEVFSYLYKIFLNSLYGKFGQTQPAWERIGDADPATVQTEHVYNADTGEYDYYKIFGGSIFKQIHLPIGENEANNSFCAIAAHVTSYARMLLWKYITIAGPENVYYMDTDSLFVNTLGRDRLAGAGVLDDSRLGAMKLEKSGQMAIYGLKDYTFKGKDDKGKDIDITKIKGVSKSAVKIDDNNYACTVWQGLSKAIEQGNLDGYHQRSMVKHLKREYDKGYRTRSGQVLPLNFEDGELTQFTGAVNWPGLAKLYGYELEG